MAGVTVRVPMTQVILIPASFVLNIGLLGIIFLLLSTDDSNVRAGIWSRRWNFGTGMVQTGEKAETNSLLKWTLVELPTSAQEGGGNGKVTEDIEEEPYLAWLQWINQLPLHSKQIYSQNGEDGILLEILRKIGETNRFFLEFGVQDGTECNTHILRENGWKGIMLDRLFKNSEINLHEETVWIDNILRIFKKYQIPKEFDVWSLDTDMNDFWLMETVLRNNYRPRIMIVEFNRNLHPISSLAIPRKEAEEHAVFRWTDHFGASALAFTKLASLYGYSLLHVESGTNLFFVLNSELGNIDFPMVAWVHNLAGQGKDRERYWKEDTKRRAFAHICIDRRGPCSNTSDW